MPDDPALGDAEMLARIRADLDYFKKAHALTGVGAQPPTVYADKYVMDLEFLLDLLTKATGGTPATPASLPKTELEVALEHDQAGRVERRKPSNP